MKRMISSFEGCLYHFQFHAIYAVQGFCCVTVAKSHHLFETGMYEEAVGVDQELGVHKMLRIESHIWHACTFFWRESFIA